MDDMNNECVYLLIHSYSFYGYDENKILGIYTSKENASDAIKRYRCLDGFKEYPEECFCIKEYILDKDMDWNGGFVSTDLIEEEFKKLTICFNEWLGINKTAEQAWENDEYYNAICDVNTEIYNATNVSDLAEKIEQIWKKRFKIEKNHDEYIKIAEKIKDEIKGL
ncbi:MAG: hypothetical protein IJ583_15330 [Firmicutes bacterium]|nr:hypothetical protein [Bacillota bacterium]